MISASQSLRQPAALLEIKKNKNKKKGSLLAGAGFCSEQADSVRIWEWVGARMLELAGKAYL